MKSSNEKIVINRFAIAKSISKVKISIVVKVAYILIFKTVGKGDDKYRIEVYSVSGSVMYDIVKVKNKIGKIYFLKNNQIYFIDLKKSTFDLL